MTTSRPEAQNAAVVLTTYNHARFLADALESCVRQSVPASEILVVDDGSTDDPGSVVARFPGVDLVRQHNQGLSAARNTGLAAVRASYVVFVDADDRLLPRAVGAGLEAAARHPDAAIIHGGFRLVDAELRPIFVDEPRSIAGDPYLAFLRANVIGAHSGVMYRRDVLVEEGGFEEKLRSCEDYDVYLRIARKHPIVSHREIVAEYRKHGDNMTGDAVGMLANALWALDRQAPFAASYPGGAEALAAGRRRWRAYYALRMLKSAARMLKRPGRRAAGLSLVRRALSIGAPSIAFGAAIWLRRQTARIAPDIPETPEPRRHVPAGYRPAHR